MKGRDRIFLIIVISALCCTTVTSRAQDTAQKSIGPAREVLVQKASPESEIPDTTTPVSLFPSAVDSVPAIALSLPSFANDSFAHYGSFVHYLLTHNRIFDSTKPILPAIIAFRDSTETGRIVMKNGIFYLVVGVLLLLAILRIAFAKYFSDLFRAFFNPTLSQRQLREQLSQTPFPSLMFNFFFTVSAGLYLFLILLHFQYFMVRRPLYLVPVFITMVIIIYVVKYLFLSFAGWLFGYRETASAYVFTLFMTNKVLGVALLPFILILAFSSPAIASVAMDLSFILIILLFIYRYIRIYGMARNQIFFHKFHFFIYLCGFEIAPILIVGKLVLIWLNGA